MLENLAYGLAILTAIVLIVAGLSWLFDHGIDWVFRVFPAAEEWFNNLPLMK